ncbi:hypothetical protein BC831DRAFT_441716 [Entophlyctis helioformis]|nr:hypothetical protein BC831DRAFT_441716 [Entophlyctis helioformis]
MCGRTMMMMDADEIQHATGVRDWRRRDQYRPSFNVGPRRHQPVLRRRPGPQGSGPPEYAAGTAAAAATDGDHILECMTWGLPMPGPAGSGGSGSHRHVINCRDDSIAAGKPMFKRLRNTHRCIVVAQGYYEWHRPGYEPAQSASTPHSTPHSPPRGKSQPYCIRPRQPTNSVTPDTLNSLPLVYFAALYAPDPDPATTTTTTTTTTDGTASYAIVTTSAPNGLAALHDRMPVMLMTANDRNAWLDTRKPFAEVAHLLAPPTHPRARAGAGADTATDVADTLMWYPVSRAVGKIGHDGIDCVMPVDMPGDGDGDGDGSGSGSGSGSGPLQRRIDSFWAHKPSVPAVSAASAVEETANVAESRTPPPQPSKPTTSPVSKRVKTTHQQPATRSITDFFAPKPRT